MIDNILNCYREYVEGRTGARDGYIAGMKELDENFKGAMLEEKKADLKTAYDTTVATYRNECISMIEPALKAAKRAVIEAASRPIPAGLYESLSAFEGLKMSDMEKEMVLEMTKNSYLARKRAIEILNLPEKELPPSMDDVIGNLETLEKVIMRSFEEPIDAYDVRLVAHGDWIGQVHNQINDFCEAYGAPKEE